MSKVNLTLDIDFDDFIPEDQYFVDFIRQKVIDSLAREIKSSTDDKIKEELEKVVNKEVASTVERLTKEKMESFLSEDIAITDKWGKANFIGSIEDLLKREFDNRLLHPVNSRGQRLEGCHLDSGEQTYVQWLVEEKINQAIKRDLDQAVVKARAELEKYIKTTIEKHIDQSAKNKVLTTIEALFQASGQQG